MNRVYLSCLWLCLLIQFGCGKKSGGGSAPVNEASNKVVTLTSEELVIDLLRAVREEKTQTLSELLHAHQFFNINEDVNEGDSLLIYSIKLHRVAAREYLLQAGSNPEIVSKHEDSYLQTPLMIAAKLGHIHTVKGLVTEEVGLDRKDPKGDTALHLALRNKLGDVALVLIKAGASTVIRNHKGETPQSLAEENNLTEVTEFLFGIRQVGLGAPNISTFRALILNGDLNSFQRTLIAHPTIAKDYESLNPLSLTIDSRDEFTSLSMAQMLLSKGLNVDGPTDADSSPFVEAVKKDKQIFAELFLKNGAAIGRADKEGKSALIYAVEQNNSRMVNFLINHNAPQKFQARVDGRRVNRNACQSAKFVGWEVYEKDDIEGIEKNNIIKAKLGCR